MVNSENTVHRFKAIITWRKKKNYIDWKSVVFFSWAVASSAFELNFLWPNEQFIHCSIQWAIAVIPSFFAYTFYIRSFENALQFNGQIIRIRKKPQSIYRRNKNVENYSFSLQMFACWEMIYSCRNGNVMNIMAGNHKWILMTQSVSSEMFWKIGRMVYLWMMLLTQQKYYIILNGKTLRAA